jgi:hypothetical protein
MCACVCMYAVLSIQTKCHPSLSPYLPKGKREGNKCVVRENDDDIPRLCVSLAVLLFFSLFLARLPVKNSFYCLVESSFFFFFLFLFLSLASSFLLPSYAVNQSFRLLCTHAIIIIILECFVQCANTSLDISKFN